MKSNFTHRKPIQVPYEYGGWLSISDTKRKWKINEFRKFNWQDFYNKLNPFTTSTKRLALAVAFAQKTNTTAQVMHLGWNFNNKILSIAFFSLSISLAEMLDPHKTLARKVQFWYKQLEHFQLTAQLKFSRRLNLLEFIRYEALVHTYQIIITITVFMRHQLLSYVL